MSTDGQHMSRRLLIIITLTDEVVEAEQCAAELCHAVSRNAFDFPKLNPHLCRPS